MVELVVLACLASNPAHCERFNVPFQQPMHLMQCLWQSQIHAAEWEHKHPGWQIKKVTCGLPQT